MRSLLYKLFDLLNRKRDISKLVNVPEIWLYDDLAKIRSAEVKTDPTKHLIVHSPINSRGEQFRPRLRSSSWMRYNGVQDTLSRLYGEGNDGSFSMKKSLESLEEAVNTSSEERTRSLRELEQVAKDVIEGEGVNQDSEQLRHLIGQITQTQFEEPEYFIREAIQNSDGSSEDKSNNRIDVFIDEKERIVRIEDKGRGMSTDVMDDVFFNLYKSINEALGHAAGKFGIGAVSFFGMGHEYVRVDSKPQEGVGGVVEVDSKLNRNNGFKVTRREEGTSVEIKFSDDSKINFQRVAQILEEDCRFIQTPLYVHRDGKTSQLNTPLIPDIEAAVIIDENNIQGHIVRVEGDGTIDLLDHQIRLSSISTKGYSAVIDCSGLDTTFSRDSVSQDPVLERVLEIVGKKSKELDKKEDKKKASLEDKLKAYHDFLQRTIYDENGDPNREWIEQNVDKFRNDNKYLHEIFSSTLPNLLNYVTRLPFALVKYFGQKDKGFKEAYCDKNVKGRGYTYAMGIPVVGGFIGGMCLEHLKKEHNIDFGNDLDSGMFLSGFYHLVEPFLIRSPVKAFNRKVVNHYYKKVNSKLKKGWSLGRTLKQKLIEYSLVAAAAVGAVGTIGGALIYVINNPPQGIQETSKLAIKLPDWLGFLGGDGSGFGAEEITIGNSDLESVVRGNSKTRDGTGYVKRRSYNVIKLGGEIELKDSGDSSSMISGIPDLPKSLKRSRHDKYDEDGIISDVREHIEENYTYGVVPQKKLDQYPTMLEGLIAEKKLICSSANILAISYLGRQLNSDMRVVSGTYNGIGHMWLEIDRGSNEKPKWEIEDFTPHRRDEEFARAMAEYKISFFDKIPPQLPLGLVLGLGGAFLIQRRRYKQDERELNDEEIEYRLNVQEEVDKISPGIKVDYSLGMGRLDQKFSIGKSEVLLNRERLGTNPEHVAFAYCINVLNDSQRAQEIISLRGDTDDN
jgi:hypothetical protein